VTDDSRAIWLRRNAQHHLAGLTIGILTVKPDPADPAVRLGVRDPESGELRQVVLRPGQPVTVFGRILVAEQIDRDAQDAVLLRIEDTAPEPDHGPTAGAAGDLGLTRLPVILAGALVLALAAGGGLGYRAWHGRQAPAMSAAATDAGAVRLTYPNRGLPNPPVTVTLTGGGKARLTLHDVSTADGQAVAEIGVAGPEGTGSDVRIRSGGSARVGAVTVTVLNAYDLPDAAHDAADVTVRTP
jgi:hypothetical protein